MAFARGVLSLVGPSCVTLWLPGCRFRSPLGVTPRDPQLLGPRPAIILGYYRMLLPAEALHTCGGLLAGLLSVPSLART